jgi:hypothetical protein
MIIRIQFEVECCKDCLFFEVDDYDPKCKLIGEFSYKLHDVFCADWDEDEEISPECPFKYEMYDEDKDTIDLDAYQSYMRRKKTQ